MSLPTLPPELQQLIIDIIGGEAVSTRQTACYGAKGGPRDTLWACSLVSKDWHDLTLPHVFHQVHLTIVSKGANRQRLSELLRMLEANPLIRKCIRHASVSLRSSSPEDLATLCSAISLVEKLYIQIEPSSLDLHHPSASSLAGLNPVLTARHLRDLTISMTHLPIRILEVLTNLRSLTLEDVEVVVSDPWPGDGDDVWARGSSPLEMLDVTSASLVLTAIAAVADKNAGLFAFFERLKHLHLYFNADHQDIRGSSWHVLLARWNHLETLLVCWNEIEAGMEFLEMCRLIPWESFQSLRCLTYIIMPSHIPPRDLFNAEADPSALIFTGPSLLPKLQDLRVTYNNNAVFLWPEDHHASLDAIYLYNLNRTIKDQSSFPHLQTFRTEVECTVHCGALFKVDEEQLVQQVMDRLPAIFGAGGRKETHSWTTTIAPSVRIVDWDND